MGLHQGSALSPLLFIIIMDVLTENIEKDPPWAMMFADDLVLCSMTREEMEEDLETWRVVLAEDQQNKDRILAEPHK